MPTISVLDSAGNPQPVELPNANGRQAAATSRPVALSTEDLAALQAIGTSPLPAGTNDLGTVHISGTVPVSGSFYQAVQPVSGPVTNAELRAAPVPVSGSFYPATQPVSILSMPSTPVTGTFWPATQPVSLASQPLPTGASTETTLASVATKLDTIHTDLTTTGVTPGVAGTPSADVLTVQGSGVSGSPQLVHSRLGSQIYNGDTVLTPKFAKIAASTSGASTVVAAVTGKKLRVLSMLLVGNGVVNANLQSHTTTATATGLQYIAAAGGGAVLPPSSLGWFETVAGEALDINLSAAVSVGGQLVYVEV